MSSGLLKKIIRRKEFKELWGDMEYSLSSPICIKDMAGKVLVGRDNCNLFNFPIKLHNDVIAWVCGAKEVSVVAELLSLWSISEYEKKSLGEELLEKYREISFYYNLTEQLAGSLEPQEVAQLLIEEAQKIIKIGDISIIIVDNNEREILATSLEDYRSLQLLKVCAGVVDSVLLRRQPEVVNSFLSDPRYVEGAVNVSSLMCAPLAIKDEILGVIIVSSENPQDYSAGDLKLLSTVAYQTAAALENAKLVARLKETIEDLKSKKNELTESLKMRMEFGQIFISVVLIVTLYTFLLLLLDNFNVNDGSIYIISRGVEIIFVIFNIWLVMRSKLPLASFGITTANAKKSIIESLLISGFLMSVLTIIKLYLIRNLQNFQETPLISWQYVGWDYYTYILVAPIQEFICRGVMQGSIQRFLLGRINWLWAIILTSSLFGIFHIHESIELGILAILGGILWGAMFVRHKTLLGVSLCHFLIGNWLGVLGFWDMITHSGIGG